MKRCLLFSLQELHIYRSVFLQFQHFPAGSFVLDVTSRLRRTLFYPSITSWASCCAHTSSRPTLPPRASKLAILIGVPLTACISDSLRNKMRGSVLSLACLAACVSVARGQESTVFGDVHNTNVDEDAVPVGIGNLRPACNTGSTGVGCSVGTNILEALEADDLVTGERGVLCAWIVSSFSLAACVHDPPFVECTCGMWGRAECRPRVIHRRRATP